MVAGGDDQGPQRRPLWLSASDHGEAHRSRRVAHDDRRRGAQMNWNARSSSAQRNFRGLAFDQLRGLVLDGELIETDWVQREGESVWREIGAVPELSDAVPKFTF